ncbi:MAG: hypothetical protein ACRCZ2_08385 [Fusobacteriaceae bacterium]
MKKIYFSKVKFNLNENEFESIKNLKKISVLELLERDLEYTKMVTIKEGDKEITENAIYNPAGSDYFDDGKKLIGAIIKTGQVITKFYDRETAEIKEIDPKNTEYKINYIYDSITGIVAYRVTSSFREEQFNSAFESLLNQAMKRTIGRTEFPFSIPDFKVEVESIYNNLNILELESELEKIEPIEEIKVSFESNNVQVQCNEELSDSRSTEYEIKIKAKTSLGINLENVMVKKIYLDIKNFLIISEEKAAEDLELKAKVNVSIKTVDGDCYSNLQYSKFKHNISDKAKLPEFYNESIKTIESLLVNELIKN